MHHFKIHNEVLELCWEMTGICTRLKVILMLAQRSLYDVEVLYVG